MVSSVTLSIDAMGGDHAPSAVIDGLVLAFERYGDTAKYILHGDQAALSPLLAEHPHLAGQCTIDHTESQVSMDQKPSEALRRGRGSSMWNAVNAVRDGRAAVAISAGNTGALMAMSKIILRMAPHAHRPAIAASWPTPDSHCVVLDVGANVEVEASQLVQFAIMGEAFARAIHGRARPSVGLLNIGQEELKGNDVVREADALIRASGVDMNYAGFVEGDDISLGTVDVVTTDGFTGNVALKTAEGTARLLAGWMKHALTNTLVAKAGAALAKTSLMELKDKMDPRKVNGGVFLGLNGVVVKSHGGADGVGFSTALAIGVDMARSHFLPEVEANLTRFATSTTTGDQIPEPPTADTPTGQPSPSETAAASPTSTGLSPAESS